MKECKKLIEVALPIKEISYESVRDKSIRHGHISTLHLWWARRPLPVCRAVVFASLVPDPLDENCPQPFKDAVEIILGKNAFHAMHKDPYQPYQDIPYTSIHDTVEDNLRNRLLMFIGKFSAKASKDMKEGNTTSPNEMLDNNSLIKWDNKNNHEIIQRARKLIWVAHNSEKEPYKSAKTHLQEFEKAYKEITLAEDTLFKTINRHISTDEVSKKEKALATTIENFQNNMPSVFDPFAGGGAIPLEASRLGCRSYGNDLNPVAHIIQKGSVEFPQKYGKSIIFSKNEFIKKYGKELYDEQNRPFNQESVIIKNRLSFDVEYYAKKLLSLAEKEIGHLYPADKNGNKPIAYYWARVATCSNPSCQAEVPLLKEFYLVNKPDKKIFLSPIVNGKDISFEIKTGESEHEGWMTSKALKCPCCFSNTKVEEIKLQAVNNKLKQRLIAVIKEGANSKTYELPSALDIKASLMSDSLLDFNKIPKEKMQKIPDLVSGRGWGIDTWGQMFSNRQLLAMQTLVEKLEVIKEELSINQNEYNKAVITYLAILIDRVAIINTSFGRYNIGRETLEHPFSKQAIPMIFDYPESNLFCTSSGSAHNQKEWLVRYLDSEADYPFYSTFYNSSSGEVNQFSEKSLSAVVTDPPYYDAIAYADLSDFFYVWLKRTLGNVYPENFAYPQTPKAEECTALKHHHENNSKLAEKHFEYKLQEIFTAIEKQTKGVVSIMFAHQSTQAWTTLCNSILNSKMNITGSWSISTEMASRTISLAGAALQSSVTVSCRPSVKSGVGEFKEIKKAIDNKIKAEIKVLYDLGFRGADLLTGCFGQAVIEFGNYEIVEKADGSSVTVSELLTLTKEVAFSAIISDINTDDTTKFYIGWSNFFGFTEAEHDDVNRITQIGLNIDVNHLIANNILIRQGSQERLACAQERYNLNNKLGEKDGCSVIDKVHRLIILYKNPNRSDLLKYLVKLSVKADDVLWRVMSALVEVMPTGMDDYKSITGLLTNKDSLLREADKNQVTQLGLNM